MRGLAIEPNVPSVDKQQAKGSKRQANTKLEFINPINLLVTTIWACGSALTIGEATVPP